MSLLARLEQSVHENGGLIVSCQPVPSSPMDKPEIVAAMAQAAASAGAVAVRIEGIENLRTVRPHLSVPIIGIIKRDLTGSPVRITPYLQDVDALAQAGADIIAFDASFRSRPVDIDSLLTRIRLHGLLAMADCSTVNEGISCHQKGIEFIGTTLSGYTGPITPVEPDLAMVTQLSHAGCRVIAEGRYNTPALAANAIEHGAWAVTVGSAITRIEHICQWFSHAVKR
ncbi:N-acetylmannosamine-6-phosphate 2-epimerase [Salmonella enterica subsp. enterica serovar Adjame]|uniref:Putative N-acetylmannosamine-6-phosphate 2-epimerase n=3 Tax=Salmonella enterica I TaxID=59201 RepID=A0A701B271_SALTM|nr:N-acetylmannosamine-6-phosphate 2-epimerase [Salmonella enterica]EAB5956844.1 N-acetylmannosamine-6-phosphate 2-epimerase [Salmonella enterica subsp. enterica serovar Manchester]ECK9484761.1 N-acetylmannosamine-6-phosphate 2-epimerase [Salmonella enterica subsp. enterica serovar Typhisuis str. CFSAN000654]EDH6295002.1 N-acetylmannosamine-6-phosphate 2-epimerase [Salmonella enterica subsp. enterica serovar Bareilly]EEH2018104.1 N-acetylmannosamine-6-phosphate 2-epimerase [Salmonella enterica 